MKKKFIIIFFVLIALGFWAWADGWWVSKEDKKMISAASAGVGVTAVEKNVGYLAQYNFENLKTRINKASEIKTIGQVLTVMEARKELVKRGDLEGKTFDFESRAISFESNGKKISGMMNLPVEYENKKSSAIIMIRGFADSEGYFIGSGSWKVADELTRNGFVTVSLDFLGFGLSDGESKDILEARFEKPMGVLDLIESVKKLDFVDPNKIGIWAHSNGGQIAISVLEVTGGNYPTVLWAPMTNPFPNSVLDTMDENSESGKIVKTRIDEFEKEYDSKLYSIDNFYNWVGAPILIHQGTADVWCKVEWQSELQNRLKELGKEVILDVREENDHNLKQDWDKVVKQDVRFFKEKFDIIK
ncbi:MAG: alpha/beta hydrolase [Candidatus Shapirobacteria bacterium]|nr:alpha/beta hydrolase [Candidatus Shapirobacteria bacterium]MDD3003179.1 alpha/beta hydrolase [Candidatus Shapirobacteria bacterium]MDD4382809.1 alpha/beta hydrolase [Candidatus Shapirobacteria bacterium]